MFKIPLDKDCQTSWDVIQLLETAMRKKLDTEAGEDREMRNLLGVYSDQWREQDMPGLWSLKAFGVAIYLDSVKAGSRPFSALPPLDPPVGLRFNRGVIEAPFDVFQFLNLVARRWRWLEMGEELSKYIRRLEVYVAHARRVLYKGPFQAEPLQDACDQLCAVFKSEYIYYELMGGPEQHQPSPKAGKRLLEYLESQAKLMRKGQQDNPTVRRLYLSTQVFPGESDSHARLEHGVFAENHRDIIESKRPGVAVESLWSRTQEYDTEGSMGILHFYSVNSVLRRVASFDWLSSILHVDTDISTEAILDLHWAMDPWILIVAGRYHIRDPVNNVTYVAKESADAIACWFNIFWARGDSTFFDGVNPHDLSSIPVRLPFSRHSFSLIS